MNQTLVSFPPIAPEKAGILILGSMPGEESLRMQQYYAHPRNAFWFIMGELFGAKPELPYQERVEILKNNQVAVWDVLKHCERKGSLDSDIIRASEVPNELGQFLKEHPTIRAVGFNGKKSFQVFQKHVYRDLSEEKRQLPFLHLPSTSPAYASLRREQKLALWAEQIQEFIL